MLILIKYYVDLSIEIEDILIFLNILLLQVNNKTIRCTIVCNYGEMDENVCTCNNVFLDVEYEIINNLQATSDSFEKQLCR